MMAHEELQSLGAKLISHRYKAADLALALAKAQDADAMKVAVDANPDAAS